VVAALAVRAACPSRPRLDAERLVEAAGRYDARILRDTWGVPHVFGRTDADAAFGLAYAHAEDDFATIQAALLAARGRLATLLGPKGAPNDYLVQLLRVWEFVERGYARDLSPDVRAVCQAYADGLNLYAARHPDAALPQLYPATGEDVVAGFVHKLPLFFGLERVLRGILEPGSAGAGDDAAPGSNALAVAPSRSADGWTRLAVNSHQPWDGPVAWYEAHVRSEEGWDAAGGLFPGAPVILHGVNRRLGWAHTVNAPDLVDVYRLELDPADPGRYRFDGGWRRLESRPARIDVRLLGSFSWRVERETLWSVHGPVVRGPRGSFALRYAGMGELRHVEQWFRMNKAHSLEAWLAAMRLNAIPMFNCGYADASGHVLYLYNARLPLRATGHDWAGTVAGDTSATLWSEYLPFDRLPRVQDPASGFVQSCNSSPFETTSGPGNPRPEDYDPSLGIETQMTNRALRALELLGADASITREEFEAFKFDVAYSTRSATAARLRQLLAAPQPSDARLREALGLLSGWELRADASDTRAALALLTLRPTDTNDGRRVATAELLRRLAAAARELRRRFGRLDVPLGEALRLRRGNLDLPLGGGPDLLRAVYARPAADGRLVGSAGDCYVLIAEWDPRGRLHARSVHVYGSATGDRRSPHHADQSTLFARMELKPLWLDEAEIRAHLEAEYRPGERR
jgi:penicillin amidase/acyl-homoserine-lactone acylase